MEPHWRDSQIDKGAYLPTQEEIHQKCLEIQSTWSTHDFVAREVGASSKTVEMEEVVYQKFQRGGSIKGE